jgi:hypothetical protein
MLLFIYGLREFTPANNNNNRLLMNIADIKDTPALLSLVCEDQLIGFSCIAEPHAGEHATFLVHVHGLSEDGELSNKFDVMTRNVPGDASYRK